MRYGKKDDSKSKKESIGKIRQTQLITTFGPGAITEMPEYTIIMGATDYWDNRSPRLNEPNLQKLLGVQFFKEPYASESDNPKGNPDMPAFRFPKMHFCPTCGKLDNYNSFGDPKRRKCSKCDRELVPSRFVTACINGHLDDFPFNWWVHYGTPSDCTEPDNYHKLSIEFRNNTGGLASIVIKCNAKGCGKERSMEGCMSKNALKGCRCQGKRPWIGFKSEFNDPEPCNAPLQALQRGASNVYFGKTKSALTIPPWSTYIQTLIDDQWNDLETAIEQGADENNFKFLLGIKFKEQIDSGKYTLEDFIKEINRRRGLQEEENTYTEQQLFEDEYKALCEGYSSDGDEPEQFHAEIVSVPETFEDYFDEVVLVKRLREVLALRGFRRITPARPDNSEKYEGVNTNEFMPLWNKSQNWLPAIEMKGEGIFLRLNETKLKEWESRVGLRYIAMEKRLGKQDIGKGMFSPRYVLLHTLSHLLIRQLTVDCGYQEAALKERIYSSYPNSSTEMAGILIYTSSSDSDGSLGGLVRQGEEELLETTLRNTLQEASWCASDPICSESEAQGYDSLNYAACHACTLLPETSCEARNCLLDRIAIVGKETNRELGYFGDFLED